MIHGRMAQKKLPITGQRVEIVSANLLLIS